MKTIKRILVPVGVEQSAEALLAAGRAIAAEVAMVGVIPIPPGESLSSGAAAARQMRQRLLALGNKVQPLQVSVIVTSAPWQDLRALIAEEQPDLLLLAWAGIETLWGMPVAEILHNPACDIAILRGALAGVPSRVMVAVRGGPYAELALQVGMSLEPSQLDALHISLATTSTDAPFKGLRHILRQLPEVNLRSVTTDDTARTIVEEGAGYDVVVLGVTARQSGGLLEIGPVAERLLRESTASVLVVKSRRPMSEATLDEKVGAQAISILVDKWFAEKTFHADEYADLQQLVALKQRQGLTVSLALPALNEEETVGRVIGTIKRALMDDVPLLDEIVLIDSDSSDRTREIAAKLGVPVHIHQAILPELGSRRGKGEALWKSLFVTRGDIIAWIDTDIVNIHPRFVYGIVGPLLRNPQVQFVKGFYRRPLAVGDKVQAGGGGRVTELTARPLLNLFYPELSGVVQPLSGEYAGRRSALVQAAFCSGYGVEIGLLIDIFERFGLRAIAQVDLLERVHHNQELEALSKMSFAIIQTVLRRLEGRYERAIIEDVNKTMKLIRYENEEYFLDVEEVAELERPPMATIAAYLSQNRTPAVPAVAG